VGKKSKLQKDPEPGIDLFGEPERRDESPMLQDAPAQLHYGLNTPPHYEVSESDNHQTTTSTTAGESTQSYGPVAELDPFADLVAIETSDTKNIILKQHQADETATMLSPPNTAERHRMRSIPWISIITLFAFTAGASFYWLNQSTETGSEIADNSSMHSTGMTSMEMQGEKMLTTNVEADAEPAKQSNDMTAAEQKAAMADSINSVVEITALLDEPESSNHRQANRTNIDQPMAMQTGAAGVIELANVLDPHTTPVKKTATASSTTAVNTDTAYSIGQWYILLARVESDKSARQYIARMHTLGLHGEAVSMSSKGKTWQSIRMTGFNNRAEAGKQLTAISKKMNISGARVERL